jgi:hypothetical protein
VSELLIPEKLYRERLARMRDLIDLNAPQVIVAVEARCLARSFRYPLRQRFFDWKIRKWPHWLMWLLDSEYRNAKLEDEA